MKDAQLISNFAIQSHLKELNLHSSTDILKETVLRFTGICPYLRKINLSGCINNNEDDDLIIRVFDDCQFLKGFEVYQLMVHRKNYNRKAQYIFRMREQYQKIKQISITKHSVLYIIKLTVGTQIHCHPSRSSSHHWMYNYSGLQCSMAFNNISVIS